MALESASFVASLVPTNPPGTDKKKQGDDHLRLIKAALQGSFPTSSKAWYNPTSLIKTVSYSVLATDMNSTILVDTTSGVLTMTLPTLASGDAGWECSFLKTNTGTNPFLIAPPSGTIQSGEISGLAATRRCVPGKRTRVLWTGTAYIAERVTHVPVGTILDCPRTTCPVGYEFAMGQTLASATTNYPDFYSANGSSAVVTDRQGRAAFGRTDMDGSDNSVITNAGSGIVGTTLGATGGAQTVTLDATMIPSHLHAQTAQQPTFTYNSNSTNIAGGGNKTIIDISTTGGSTTVPTNDDATPGNTGSTGGGLAHNNMPPAIITNFIVVVE